MKARFQFLVVGLLCSVSVLAQNVSTRSGVIEIKADKNTKFERTTVPMIRWQTPIPDVNYSMENRVKVKFTVESPSGIKKIRITITDVASGASLGGLTVVPEAGQRTLAVVERTLNFPDGENMVSVFAESEQGAVSKSFKKVRVGAEAFASANKLDRTDYALIFATDQYDNWNDLVNPVFDSRAIAEELKKNFGFKVEVVENASQDEILKKIREYGEKKYKPLDQVFIFFAGHGTYDQTFGEGFVVTKESLLNDEAKTSYLSHNRLRSIVNNIPCEHIFLAMDVCFGGTFDEELASSRGAEEEIYKEQDNSEFIVRKLTMKTRRYLTSGGKTYVSDGIPGKHSPFAKNFIEGLQSKGGKDGILTLQELFVFVEKLKIQPRFGQFGDNLPGSDFIFVAK